MEQRHSARKWEEFRRKAWGWRAGRAPGTQSRELHKDSHLEKGGCCWSPSQQWPKQKNKHPDLILLLLPDVPLGLFMVQPSPKPGAPGACWCIPLSQLLLQIMVEGGYCETNGAFSSRVSLGPLVSCKEERTEVKCRGWWLIPLT